MHLKFIMRLSNSHLVPRLYKCLPMLQQLKKYELQQLIEELSLPIIKLNNFTETTIKGQRIKATNLIDAQTAAQP